MNDVPPCEDEEVPVVHQDFRRWLVATDLAALLRYPVVALRHLSADTEGPCLSEREHRHDHHFWVLVRSHKIVRVHLVTLDEVDRRLRGIRDLLCDGQERRMYRAVLVRPGAAVSGVGLAEVGRELLGLGCLLYPGEFGEHLAQDVAVFPGQEPRDVDPWILFRRGHSILLVN